MKPLNEAYLRELLRPYRLTPADVRPLGGGREAKTARPLWGRNPTATVRYIGPAGWTALRTSVT